MKYLSNELKAFSNQIKYAFNKYRPHGFNMHEIERVVICGLGGSAIAGKISKSIFAKTLPIPIEVISSYYLPAYVTGDTLLIASSYSGNTEETLSMYQQARKRELRILTISTGGELFELAGKDKVINYAPEKGYQPRMALGYSLSYLIMILEELQKKNEKTTDWEKISEYFSNSEVFISKAKSYFEQIKTIQNIKRFIIVTDENSLATGIRFCQQLQENAKTEAFVIELPEACHNVIETFYSSTDAIYIFLNSNINQRMNLRFKFFNQLLSSNNNKAIEIDFTDNQISDLYETIYILDWISLLIADHKSINSSEIKNINNLKTFLSEN